jgi:AcrR family transcriptional regulator
MYAAVMAARDRLIESTQELLWERGYTGTSPRAIQDRAGAGQGSMYHHFGGKPDLAGAALQRTAEQLRAEIEDEFSAGSTAIGRICAYLHRERDVLRGCRIGRMTQDPDVVANPDLRRPLAETFDWLRGRLADILTEGQAKGEVAKRLEPAQTAATIAAVLQGGYVLARAADSVEPFDDAIDGVLALLDAVR